MSNSELRYTARENLRGNWGLSIGVAAIAFLLGGLLIGSSFLPDFESFIKQEYQNGFSSGSATTTSGFRINFGSTSSPLGLVAFVIGGVIELGYAQFLLKQYNREHYEFGDLFSQFHRFGQGFAQSFLRGLYVFLWSLLLIIPGIIKSYAYAMTPFIMADNPDMTASEAITASKELMEGHKGDLFFLNLSFIGWDILCALTLNIGALILNPYKNAARAAFYKSLTSPNVIEY